MRIVIIGEFSSFAKNLSEGFKALGHECFVFSWADGFKGINQETQESYAIALRKAGDKGFLAHIKNALFSYHSFLQLYNYVDKMSNREKWDVALIINPVFIKQKERFWNACFTEKMIKSLLLNTEQIYFSACGGDVPYIDYWKNHPWKNSHIVEVDSNRYYTESQISHFIHCMSFIQKAIPVMYGYAQAWRNSEYTRSCKILPTIPLPINTSKYEVNNTISGKIVVFHGIIRPEQKGTPLIVKAMDRLQKNFPDKVECVAKGGMSLNEYLPLLNRTNILIDQAYADSVGMNGLYALAMGKVVLGGNAPENQKEFNEYDCPIVNIEPDVEDIYCKLEDLILNSDKIGVLSKKSREYVERVHDAKVIAKKYISVFEGELLIINTHNNLLV